MIKSLPQYILRINSIKLKSDFGMYPPKLLFRGLSDCRYELTPSLDRCPSPFWLNNLQIVEKDLVQLAQQKYPMLFSTADYPVILLAKLQHYGIPTRMMDITENALVALYFACRENDDTDGEVVAFSGFMHSAYNPIANIIADTYRLTDNDYTEIENYRFRAMSQSYSARLLYPNWVKSNPKVLKGFVNSLKSPIFIEAGTVYERQKMQSGKFILFPNESDLENDRVFPGIVKLEKTNRCIVKRIKIPRVYKKDLIEQLKRFGIAEDLLYSDDVDKVCECIVRVQKERYPKRQ